MAVAVVEALEVVDVDCLQGQRGACTAGALELDGQLLVEVAAVEQVGERVAQRGLLQRLAQREVGQELGHVAGEETTDLLIGSGGFGVAAHKGLVAAQADQAGGLAVGEHRHAAAVAVGADAEVVAADADLVLVVRIGLVLAQAPAIVELQGLGRLVLQAPRSQDPELGLTGLGNVDGAGVGVEELGGKLARHPGGLVGRGAGLQHVVQILQDAVGPRLGTAGLQHGGQLVGGVTVGQGAAMHLFLQVGSHLAQLVLHLHLVAQVGDDRQAAAGGGALAHGRAGDLHGHQATIRAQQVAQCANGLAALLALQQVDDVRTFGLGHQFQQGTALHLLGGGAQHVGQSGVGQTDATHAVQDPDAFGGRVHQQAVARLGQGNDFVGVLDALDLGLKLLVLRFQLGTRWQRNQPASPGRQPGQQGRGAQQQGGPCPAQAC